MAQVSKVPVRKEVYLRVFEVFVSTISRLKDKKDIVVFLNEFFTPTEKIMFVKRFAIPILYEKGYTYRDISSVLKVSTATVSRVIIFYNLSDEFRELIKKFLEEEKTKKFLLDLGDIIASAAGVSGAKASSWFALKKEIKKKKARNNVF